MKKKQRIKDLEKALSGIYFQLLALSDNMKVMKPYEIMSDINRIATNAIVSKNLPCSGVDYSGFKAYPPMDLICKADLEEIATRFKVADQYMFRVSGEMTDKKAAIVKRLIKSWADDKREINDLVGRYFDENGNEFYISAE